MINILILFSVVIGVMVFLPVFFCLWLIILLAGTALAQWVVDRVT